MDRPEEFRNAPMRSRTLVPFERALAEGMAGEIRNKVTIYRSALDPADRHFPRIEYVRDSFGNTPTGGSPTDTFLTVSPSIPMRRFHLRARVGTPRMGHSSGRCRCFRETRRSLRRRGDKPHSCGASPRPTSRSDVRPREPHQRPRWHRETGSDDRRSFRYAVDRGDTQTARSREFW